MKTVYDKRTTFIAMDGTEVHFKPFSYISYEMALENLRQEYRDRGEPIDCPQYVVKYANGTQAKFDHTQDSIKQAPPDILPEDKARVLAEQLAQWQAWQECTKKFDVEGNAILWDFIRNDSLSDLKLPADNSWEAKQTRRHIRIPADPEEKLMHYLNTELLKSTADQLEFIETIVLVSRGMVEEAHLETAKKSFRHSLWSDGLAQLAKWDAARETENTQVERMDSQPQVDDHSGAERVEINEG